MKRGIIYILILVLCVMMFGCTDDKASDKNTQSETFGTSVGDASDSFISETNVQTNDSDDEQDVYPDDDQPWATDLDWDLD